MSNTLIEDTGTLLLLDIPEGSSELDDAFVKVSLTVVTHASLAAKTKVYNQRITRAIADAANCGAPLDDLAEAAGCPVEEVVQRLDGYNGLDPSVAAEVARRLAPRRRWWNRKRG